MASHIASVKNKTTLIVKETVKANSSLQLRAAFVGYRDPHEPSGGEALLLL